MSIAQHVDEFQTRAKIDHSLMLHTARGVGPVFKATEIPLQMNGRTFKVRMFDTQLVSSPGKIYHLHSNAQVAPALKPETPAQATMIDGGEIEFKLKKGRPIKKINAKFVVNNSDGSNSITVVPAHLLFRRVEYNVGTNTLFHKSGIGMYLDECLHQDKTRGVDIKDEVNNINSSTYAFNASTGVIAASGSQTYNIDVSPWKNAPMFFDSVEDDIMIKFFFQNATKHKVAGSAAASALELGTFTLEVIYHDMHPFDMNTLKAQFNAGIAIRIPTETISEKVMTLANSTEYDLQLRTIKSLCPEAHVIVRPSTLTGADQYTFSDILGNLEFFNDNNKSLTSGKKWEAAYLRSHVASDNFANPHFIKTSNLLTIPFTQGGASQLMSSGKVVGYETLHEPNLKISTNGSAGGSTYNIQVLAKRYSMLVFENGKLTIRHS